MQENTSFFDTKIEFLKGVGPQRAEILQKELQIFTFGDLLEHYPFRYEDRTRFYTIAELNEELPTVQFKGRIRHIDKLGEGFKTRLVARFTDGTGEMELTWFQSVPYYEKFLKVNGTYVVYGKATIFGTKWQITHPEIDILSPENELGGYFQPIYSLTDKLRKRYIDSRAFTKMHKALIEQAYQHIRETLPVHLVQKFRLVSKAQAIRCVHLPQSPEDIRQAERRLKFEELFYNQLRLIKQKIFQKIEHEGQIFTQTNLLNTFYEEHLPFSLTNAQKRVIREISEDMKIGKQMNRLLQGDVGSGKTIVAFICMLLAIDNDAQCCIMAPTEILATQHYHGLKELASKIGVKIELLTGSSTKRHRSYVHESLLKGLTHILVGTHAVLEDPVQFQNLGFCVIDEQHRFGVAQRAKLWAKNPLIRPHILVMTATPIPRTLAMTLYGDLDISVIDEMPEGRKPIRSVHRYDADRLRVFGFLREEITKGRQIYMVYPLIEESEKMDFKDLTDGYESVCRAFPDLAVSMVHGKMSSKDKNFEMERFVKQETQIMVATTVIEVGVNVPNASVMVIESAERFGLSQLHQLRGRVGRGSDQSYCVLMTDYKLSKETRTRIETMVRTNNGFEIAEVDLQLRGPGDLLGTQQSGLVDLRIADLAKDGEILRVARESAQSILESDPLLETADNYPIKHHLDNLRSNETNWSRIS